MSPLNLANQPKTRAKGRRSKRPELTPYEAKLRAHLLRSEGNISATLSNVVEALAVAGVLTASQLHRVTTVSLRSLQRYHRQHLLDRIYLPPTTLLECGLSTDPADLRLYTLGMIGLELVESTHSLVPTGYAGYGTHRITHDVLTNETVLRVAQAAIQHSYEPIWHSRYEATVHDDAGRPALEPDAMLTLKHATRPRHRFVFEYHNEDHAGRAEAKLRRYETTARDGHWQSAWSTDHLPAVLIVWTYKAVGTGYKDAIASARTLGLRGTYYGKSLRSLLAGDSPLTWFNFNTDQAETLLA